MQYVGNLAGYQTEYNTRSSVSFHSQNTGSQFHSNQAWPQSMGGVAEQNAALISLSPTNSLNIPSSLRQASQSGSSFMSDLEGLDFSLTASTEPAVPKTETSAGSKIYPDISGAFR